jgi:hypothetical protein
LVKKPRKWESLTQFKWGLSHISGLKNHNKLQVRLFKTHQINYQLDKNSFINQTMLMRNNQGFQTKWIQKMDYRILWQVNLIITLLKFKLQNLSKKKKSNHTRTINMYIFSKLCLLCFCLLSSFLWCTITQIILLILVKSAFSYLFVSL